MRGRFVGLVKRHATMRSTPARGVSNATRPRPGLRDQLEAHLAFPAEHSASRVLGKAVRVEMVRLDVGRYAAVKRGDLKELLKFLCQSQGWRDMCFHELLHLMRNVVYTFAEVQHSVFVGKEQAIAPHGR